MKTKYSKTATLFSPIRWLAFGTITAHHLQNLMDLKIPSSNRLEKLTGKLREYHGIRIYDQWRITFTWKNNNSHEVTILDYHQ